MNPCALKVRLRLVSVSCGPRPGHTSSSQNPKHPKLNSKPLILNRNILSQASTGLALLALGGTQALDLKPPNLRHYSRDGKIC